MYWALFSLQYPNFSFPYRLTINHFKLLFLYYYLQLFSFFHFSSSTDLSFRNIYIKVWVFPTNNTDFFILLKKKKRKKSLIKRFENWNFIKSKYRKNFIWVGLIRKDIFLPFPLLSVLKEFGLVTTLFTVDILHSYKQ